jgi:Transcription-repair coupling factor (superfamily II helicase)
MRDLEIRGAGNLLGPEQHGHMESVGYDMYCRLLDEAVRELTGEAKPVKEADIQIDINVSAYIDSSYINNESNKIEMYKRIAAISDMDDVIDVQDELTDRYGDIPEETSSLISIALIKSMAARCGFASIQEKGENIVLQYYPGKMVDFRMLGILTDKYKRNILFTANNSPYITYKAGSVSKKELLENIKLLLQVIIDNESGISANT